MGWSMDRQGIRTLFDHESKRLKQVELSGPRRERVSLDTYSDELAAREVEFRQGAKYAHAHNLLRIEGVQRAPPRNAGVVHQDGHRPQLFFGTSDHHLDRGVR